MFLAHKQYFPLFLCAKLVTNFTRWHFLFLQKNITNMFFFVFGDIFIFILVLFAKPLIDIMICACSFLVYQWKMILLSFVVICKKLLPCISLVKHIFAYWYKTLFLFLFCYYMQSHWDVFISQTYFGLPI